MRLILGRKIHQNEVAFKFNFGHKHVNISLQCVKPMDLLDVTRYLRIYNYLRLSAIFVCGK